MGQVNTNSAGRKGRHGISIDMTPMVDLAFLLLTFFVLTMTINSDYAKEIQTPDNSEKTPTTPINVKRVLTLLLGKEDRIYYYYGDQPNVQTTDYSKDGLRKLLLDAKKTIPKLVILIKPSRESKYKNLVDALDEAKLTNNPHYYIMKETEDDRTMIASVLEN